MKRSWIKADRGFTLVELLVVAGMLGVVMTAIYSLYQTQQRSAYVQEDVVEVQQNLRIALDSITNDIRMAGFLVDKGLALPIQTATNNTDLGNSDTLTLNYLSSSNALAMAWIDIKVSPTNADATQLGVGSAFTVDSRESLDHFKAGAADGDWVKIVRPENAGAKDADSLRQIYKVTAKDRGNRSMTLVQLPAALTGGAPSAANWYFKNGDVIVKVPPTVPVLFPGPYYCTIKYYITDHAGIDSCPAGTTCLVRSENDTPAVVATNIANLQFSYINSGTDTQGDPTPPDLSLVRAIRVELTGLTSSSAGLSDKRAKVRQLSSVVRLMNKK